MKIVNYNIISYIIFISNNKILIISTYFIIDQECGIFDMEPEMYKQLPELKFESEIYIEILTDSKLYILSKNVSTPNITIFDIDRCQIENIIHIDDIHYTKLKNQICISKITHEIIYGLTDGNIYLYK